MITGTLVLQIVSYLAPLVLGYLLRHWNIAVPGLPTPAPAPAVDHVGLLRRVLGVGKEEAEGLLETAAQDILAKGLADLKAAAQTPASK